MRRSTSTPAFLASLLAFSMTSACGNKSTAPADSTTIPSVSSADSDDAQPAPATQSGAADVATATNAAGETNAADSVAKFASALLQQVQQADGDGNLAISPWSVESALLMTAAGAKGETLDQLLRALGFEGQSPDGVHAAVSALQAKLLLAARERNDDGSLDDDSDLHTANAVWIDTSLRDQLNADYEARLRNLYGSAIQTAGFSTDAERARQEINRWVEDNTDDKIKDLIARGVIQPDTSMVLTNAVHFDADWEFEFDEDRTTALPFHRKDGTQVNTQTMTRTFDQLETWRGDGFQAFRLPYEDGCYAMDIVLPNQGAFDTVRGQLYEQGTRAIFDVQRRQERVNVWLPKFTFDFETRLETPLQALGATLAFSGNADFSGIFNETSQAIGAVIHKVYIDVDEEGTEAAAATAVVMVRSTAAMPRESRDIRVDRPFLFAIRDVETGTPLFVGQVTDPSQR